MTVKWNPADKSADITLSLGDTLAECTTAFTRAVRATSGHSTGKKYFELVVTGASATPADWAVGVGDSTFDLELSLKDVGQVAWAVDGAAEFFDNSTGGTFGAPLPDNADTIGVAVDFTAGYIWFFVDGALMNGSVDPPDATNYDFATITGTLFPAASTSLGNPGIACRFLAIDMLYGPPAGFDAWDASTVLEETITSNASFSSTMSHEGSLYHQTLTSTADGTEVVVGVNRKSITLTSDAGSSDTDESARVQPLMSDAAASSTLTFGASMIDGAISSAVASSAFGAFGIILTQTSSAAAAATLDARTAHAATSTANATSTASGLRTAKATLVSSTAATDADALQAVQAAASTSGASETVLGIRRVTATITDTAGAAAANSSGNHTEIELVSNAVVAQTPTLRTTAHLTLVSNAEAESAPRLPAASIENFWVNPQTGAAAIWRGLPFNSMIEHDGRVYGAGQDGISELVEGANDDGVTISSNVLWDLMTFGSPQRKRLGALYVMGASATPLTLTVTTDRGTWRYKTDRAGAGKNVQHRAVPGRGLDAVYYRVGLEHGKDFSADQVIIDHEQIARRA